MKKIGIVGAGFGGAVIARELAETGQYECTVFDERKHVAGNCYTKRDSDTGIMVHEYGPHIFNTSREDVWKYVNRWSHFGPYVNRVKAVTQKGVFSLPLNLLTINQFFGKQFNPLEAREFIQSIGDQTIETPKNFEEQALKFMGRELYENFFFGYTKKQWGVDPKELPASILQRLPIRFSYDDNYYNQKYQGIPVDGYTSIVDKILSHKSIEVVLGQRFFPNEKKDEYNHIFWSGPLDAWFNYSQGKLGYRTLTFERFKTQGDFQGNAVINYCEEKVPYTRISEHKHFTPWEQHENTICFQEFSKLTKEGDVPYYPLRLSKDKEILAKYIRLAKEETNVTFIGRLGTYRYLDMHQVIGESLDLAKKCLTINPEMERWPSFSVAPL
ncbi:MAG: UDP-galactopyranose mutase [Bdellovibrionia bacterium]